MRNPCILSLGILLAGCASAPEPEAAFVDLPELAYPAQVVFESLAEAVESEGLVIASSPRSGERAEIVTDYRITGRDALTGVEEAQRVRLRVIPAPPEKQRVRGAFSVFERRPNDDWAYLRADDGLRARIEEHLRRILAARYR